MPLRQLSPRAAPLLYGAIPRPFHSSRLLRDDVDPSNHYETLNLRHDASPADIKKAFYTLSKTHHPDHNRADPHAPTRFMRISEAYAVLGNPTARTKYDRDVLRLHLAHHNHNHNHNHHARPSSYHSSSSTATGPAGGRPPSGLSRRRSAFRGPPPSFYRSGGWGAHSAKRQTAHDGSTGGAGGTGTGTGTGDYSGGTAGGMGPGQDPYGHRDDVPHFDRESHARTHRRVDERRAAAAARRRAGALYDDGPIGPSAGSTAANFFLITGILMLAVLGPVMVIAPFRRERERQRKLDKG